MKYCVDIPQPFLPSLSSGSHRYGVVVFLPCFFPVLGEIVPSRDHVFSDVISCDDSFLILAFDQKVI